MFSLLALFSLLRDAAHEEVTARARDAHDAETDRVHAVNQVCPYSFFFVYHLGCFCDQSDEPCGVNLGILAEFTT